MTVVEMEAMMSTANNELSASSAEEAARNSAHKVARTHNKRKHFAAASPADVDVAGRRRWFSLCGSGGVRSLGTGTRQHGSLFTRLASDCHFARPRPTTHHRDKLLLLLPASEAEKCSDREREQALADANKKTLNSRSCAEEKPVA